MAKANVKQEDVLTTSVAPTQGVQRRSVAVKVVLAVELRLAAILAAILAGGTRVALGR